MTNTFSNTEWSYVCDQTTNETGAVIERLEFLCRKVGHLTAQVSQNGRGFWVGQVTEDLNHTDVTPECSNEDLFRILSIMDTVLERPQNQPKA